LVAWRLVSSHANPALVSAHPYWPHLDTSTSIGIHHHSTVLHILCLL
jgi:hypothetical protein